ncbi:endonuclease domain-containing protein [Paradesertivirga mongoliensis]|uniref:Endonuclease domain-containing protein n=1 Tax=Paradesertivirga mongoliensis TaxID=2100740 RepID=A0ABW4ZPY4_9SPHI|nr:endonuclease domain-containing protein [Pedobacter mongoliensis]
MDAKPFRRLLRRQSTPAEKVLWNKLRDRRFHNLKFRRQHTIDKYTVDFYCEELKLIIEVDGKVHDNLGQANYDHERDEFLKSQGCSVYRLSNESVIRYLEVTMEDLKRSIEKLVSKPKLESN